MTKPSANPLKDLLDRIEIEAASPTGVPDAAFSAIARKMGDASFVLPDQAAWDDVQAKLEEFEGGEDYQLGEGAVEVLAAVASRTAPLLSGKTSLTPQIRAVDALGAAFKSSHQHVQIEAAKALGKYSSAAHSVPVFAADTLRKGFGAEDHFVKDAVLTAFARAAANMHDLHHLRAEIDGLETGLQNANSAHAVANYLSKIARQGKKHAAIAINVIDRTFLTPELDSEVYDEGIEALSKIGLLDKDSAVRAIAAIADLSPRWQAGTSGHAGLTSALANIALAYPSVASQAIDVLFSDLKESFENNDAAVQYAAADAVTAIAAGLPAHEADIRSRLRKLACGASSDVKEMTAKALKGIEPAREAARSSREIVALANELGRATPPML